MHPIFTLWATSEPELASILLAIAKAIESNAMAHQKLLEYIPNDEHEYITYVEAVKSALSRRDSMQIEYEIMLEGLTRRRLEKERVLILYICIFLSINLFRVKYFKLKDMKYYNTLKRIQTFRDRS